MKEDGIGNLFEYMYKLSIDYMTLLVFISFIFIDTKLLVLLARPAGKVLKEEPCYKGSYKLLQFTRREKHGSVIKIC